MIFARNAAMGFNRISDRRYDKLNPRTKDREIPSGLVTTKAASVFVIVNSMLFIITTGFINKLTLFLSPVALFIILGYSLSKRYTSLSHFILGLGLSLAPVGAYISVTGAFTLLPVIYSLIVITWVSGFDIIYSLQDDDFDRSNQLYSIPAVAGRRRAILISLAIHIFTIILVITAGYLGEEGLIYWIGAVIFSVLLIYQHMIVKHDDLSRVTMAFGTTNGFASILFSVFVILNLILKHR
jgi:4-hydroxybenzoate polyprenyltransferase